ncbi:MAG: hypothetical protein SGPRY_014498, partial [Prymnesium sp.]
MDGSQSSVPSEGDGEEAENLSWKAPARATSRACAAVFAEILCKECDEDDLDVHHNRSRTAPARYKPEDFWRRELPAEAKDSATQLHRAAARECERTAAWETIKLNSFTEGRRQTDELVASLREKILATASELKAVKEMRAKEAAEASAYKRKAEAMKRQKTLTEFFTRPQTDGVRSRGNSDAALGQGYTDRNIKSKTFSHHVTEVEECIIALANGDASKQLQLAAQR